MRTQTSGGSPASPPSTRTMRSLSSGFAAWYWMAPSKLRHARALTPLAQGSLSLARLSGSVASFKSGGRPCCLSLDNPHLKMSQAVTRGVRDATGGYFHQNPAQDSEASSAGQGPYQGQNFFSSVAPFLLQCSDSKSGATDYPTPNRRQKSPATGRRDYLPGGTISVATFDDLVAISVHCLLRLVKSNGRKYAALPGWHFEQGSNGLPGSSVHQNRLAQPVSVISPNGTTSSYCTSALVTTQLSRVGFLPTSKYDMGRLRAKRQSNTCRLAEPWARGSLQSQVISLIGWTPFHATDS